MTSKSSMKKSTISTYLVMLCTLLSRLMGFIRIAAISYIFGAGYQADVLNAVFAIPNNLRKLLAEGALSSAFIPVLSKSIINKKYDESKKLVSNILTFQLLILIPLCLLSIIFAKPLIKYILVEFSNPDQQLLAIKLFRYFINYIIFISISAVLIAVLNSNGYFFIPSVTPILFSVCVISSIIIFHKSLGIFSMAIGILSGGLAQILFQVPQYKKLGYNFKLNFDFKNETFKRILKQWGPVLATSSVFIINQQIAVRFATGLETGSSSALHYALVFWQLPFGLFSASITTVLFPRMSKQAAINDINGLKETLQYGLKFLFYLLIPSSLILFMYGTNIISIALQRGSFNYENAVMTGNVLKYYSIGLFGVGAFNFLQRYFYSIGDYKSPFKIAVFISILDISLSIYLKETRFRVNGLALANSISFTLGFIYSLFMTKKHFKSLPISNIFGTIFKVLLSLIPPILFTHIFFKMLDNNINRYLETALILGAICFCGILIIIMYYLLKIDIIKVLLKRKK